MEKCITSPFGKEGVVLKVPSYCHSERSEESVLSPSGNGFFVVEFTLTLNGVKGNVLLRIIMSISHRRREVRKTCVGAGLDLPWTTSRVTPTFLFS